MNKYFSCPFCGEIEFDLIGLKYHLLFICEIFSKTHDITINRGLKK